MLRKKAGLTQAELAAAVNVSQSYIARLERGTIDPKISVVRRIYDYLTSIPRLTCGDVMSPNPVVIDARDAAWDAARLMLEHGFSQLPVVRGGIAVGMVDERDIIRNLNRNLRSMSVQAVMGGESAPRADEQTSINSVLPLFENFQAILVEKSGRLSGILTRSDIVKFKMTGRRVAPE